MNEATLNSDKSSSCIACRFRCFLSFCGNQILGHL